MGGSLYAHEYLQQDARMHTEQPWYALQVRPRFEKQVAATLLSKGYEGFLPLYRCKRRWSDCIKEIEPPLFSGYLFCQSVESVALLWHLSAI